MPNDCCSAIRGFADRFATVGLLRISIEIKPKEMIHRPDTFSYRIRGRDSFPDKFLRATDGLDKSESFRQPAGERHRKGASRPVRRLRLNARPTENVLRGPGRRLTTQEVIRLGQVSAGDYDRPTTQLQQRGGQPSHILEALPIQV